MKQKLIFYNPHDQSVVGETDISTPADVEKAVSKAGKAFSSWKRTPVTKRAQYIQKFHKIFLDHQEKLATLITKEMGKPLQQSRDEITAELGFVDWYAKHAEEALGEKIIKETETAVYKSVYEPWGVCASIAPWNFPITMASSGIIQQILAGNTVVFKPSELSTLSQKRFVDLLNESGLPEGVVDYVIGNVGRQLVDSPVDLIWFTGSTAVGQEIYAKCGKKLIRGIMELGGSSPGIVFADCDLEKTLEQLYWARFLNGGQVCNAVKRLFVQKEMYSRVVAGLKKRLSQLKIGNPMDGSDMGPLVSQEQLKLIVSQVEDAKEKEAVVEIGGEKPTGKQYEKGNYYLPTILTNVNKNMRIIKEETFGPVLPIMTFETEKEAVRLANNTEYGLSAEIYTTDMEKASRVSRLLDAGIIGVNTCNYFVPFCPAGGFKRSGMGREYGIEGFQELAQLKYICVAK